MAAGHDIAYRNTGVANAEGEGTKLHDSLSGQHPDAKLAGKLSADASEFGKNATERQAFWSHVIGSSSSAAEAHLPAGFHLDGKIGDRVVKDAKGHTIYDEAKTTKTAEKDGRIHDGEGPYASFRRQGMTNEEAKAAADDVKATTGKGNKGFKSGNSFRTNEDEKGEAHGDWHDKEKLDAGKAKAEKYVADEKAKIDAEQRDADTKATALKAQGTLVAGTSNVLDKFGTNGWSGKYMYHEDVKKLLAHPGKLSTDQLQSAQFMDQNFDKMAGSNSYLGSKYINPTSLAAFTSQEQASIKASQAQVAASAAALAERTKANFI